LWKSSISPSFAANFSRWIRDAQRAPRNLVFVRRPDAAPRGADGIRATRSLARFIECNVRRKNERAARRHSQPLEHRHALVDEHLRLFEQRLQRDDTPVADVAAHLRTQDACRNQREDGLLATDDERMARVVPSLEARHGGGLLGEEVHDLAFAFIAPLGTDDDDELAHLVMPLGACLSDGHLLRPSLMGCLPRSFRLHRPRYARETIAAGSP
jgi:hypothetical protein